MPLKIDDHNLTLTDETREKTEYGDLIIDFHIIFPSKLDSKRIEILKKVLNHKENQNDSQIVACYYKDKEDIVKEIINETNEDEMEPQCIQQ